MTSSKPKKLSTAARIIEIVRGAGGLIVDELKERLPHVHPQTVNSTTNTLVQRGILRDSGERRQGRAEGGRPSIVYIFEPNPKPLSPKKKKAKVIDLNEHRMEAEILRRIQDESICKTIAKWAQGKPLKQRATKAWHLSVPLVGTSRGGIVNMAEVQAKEDPDIVGTIDFGRK
jgi:hypothetical protein